VNYPFKNYPFKFSRPDDSLTWPYIIKLTWVEGNRGEEEEGVEEEEEKEEEEEERAGTSGRTADVRINCQMASTEKEKNEREKEKDRR